VLRKNKNYTGAIRNFGKAINLDPKHEAAYFYRAEVFVTLKKYQEALSDFDVTIELNPKFAHNYFGRGAVHHILGPDGHLIIPPSVAGSKSPSDSVLTFTLFTENRQSYSLLHPSFSFFSFLWESRVAASLSR